MIQVVTYTCTSQESFDIKLLVSVTLVCLFVCLGADTVRFKAEINFDGREVARVHLSRMDLEKLLKVVCYQVFVHCSVYTTSKLRKFLFYGCFYCIVLLFYFIIVTTKYMYLIRVKNEESSVCNLEFQI